MPVIRQDREKGPPAHIQRTIDLLRQRGPLTAKDVGDAMGVTLHTARNYIDLASRYVPVTSYPAYGETKYGVNPEP